MAILQQRDEDAVRRRFAVELKRDVEITLFTRQALGGLYVPGRECRSCEPAQQLLEEISALSDKVHLEIVDYYSEHERAETAAVTGIPAILIGSNGSSNIRFYGLPSGLGFAVLLDALALVSRGRSELSLKTRKSLSRLTEDVHVQVFVTPTGQQCPDVARLAYRLAIESPNVLADVVDAQEFPRLAGAYGVREVPKTVINDQAKITGPVDEEAMLDAVLNAMGGKDGAGNSEHEAASRVSLST